MLSSIQKERLDLIKKKQNEMIRSTVEEKLDNILATDQYDSNVYYNDI
ncbi:MAG: hypothetical protein WCR71_01975 [Bacteroidales bacterium]